MRGIDAKENWDARTKHEREREINQMSLTCLNSYSYWTL